MLNLADTLTAAAARDPHATAVVAGAQRFSYAEWLHLVRCLAHGLQQAGIRPGERLLLVLQNRYELAALHWACQFAGIVSTPLNWRVKAEEFVYFQEDTGATAVVYDRLTKAAVAQSSLLKVGLDEKPAGGVSFQDLAASTGTGPLPAPAATDMSVMFYTSGTTGRGKGVPRSHFAERAAAIAHVAQNRYGYGERTLGVMPLYHTMGIRSLLAMAVINGCFVCQSHFSATHALELIEAERITNLYLVPTLYHDLLASPAFFEDRVRSVKKLGFAGASMTDGLLQRVKAAFQPALFVNHYGSSEIYTFTIEPDAPDKPGSAGKAGINQEIRVVAIGGNDPAAEMAPDEEGEIIASLNGDEAFTGYWQRPDANAKSLKQGWYFTGDIGFKDTDGDLFVTGRVDDMIISGGENIMPAEIESCLSLHPAVGEVAVVGLPHERWGQQVTAFVQLTGPGDAATLDAWCRASSLADFKRPRAYHFIDSIPKSPVGKILRRILVAQYSD